MIQFFYLFRNNIYSSYIIVLGKQDCKRQSDVSRSYNDNLHIPFSFCIFLRITFPFDGLEHQLDTRSSNIFSNLLITFSLEKFSS